jgi:hypothetical protein
MRRTLLYILVAVLSGCAVSLGITNSPQAPNSCIPAGSRCL